MNLLGVIVGVFLAATILRNEDYNKPENRDMRSSLTSASLFLILGGLPFLWPKSAYLPVFGSLIFLMVMFSITTAYASGFAKVTSRIAWFSVIIFIIMGSFM